MVMMMMIIILNKLDYDDDTEWINYDDDCWCNL